MSSDSPKTPTIESKPDTEPITTMSKDTSDDVEAPKTLKRTSVAFSRVKFTGIACTNGAGLLGINTPSHTSLPWKSLPYDSHLMQRELAKADVVIVGIRTWKGLPESIKKLDVHFELFSGDVNAVMWAIRMTLLKKDITNGNVLVFGGAHTYRKFLPYCEEFLLHVIDCPRYHQCGSRGYARTLMHSRESTSVYLQGDKTATPWHKRDTAKVIATTVEGTLYNVSGDCTLERDFYALMQEIIAEGSRASERTCTGMYSLFGRRLSFNMAGRIPEERHRPSALRMIVGELQGIIGGVTDADVFAKYLGCTVWKDNTTDQAQVKAGARYGCRVLGKNDIGASYGHNMHCIGEPYDVADHPDGTAESTVTFMRKVTAEDAPRSSQLYHVIRQLVADIRASVGSHLVRSRELRISLWNPAAPRSLNPCLEQFQFSLARDGSDNYMLNLLATQRSSDISLAGHWNMTYCTLLTHVIVAILRAQTGVNIIPGTLTWSLGDVHLYTNQIKEAYEVLARHGEEGVKPYRFTSICMPAACLEGTIGEQLTAFALGEWQMLTVGGSSRNKLSIIMN